MNKFLKVFVAILGGVDVVFSFLLPILIVLLVINTLILSTFEQTLIILIGCLATLYRGIKYLLIE